MVTILRAREFIELNETQNYALDDFLGLLKSTDDDSFSPATGTKTFETEITEKSLLIRKVDIIYDECITISSPKYMKVNVYPQDSFKMLT